MRFRNWDKIYGMGPIQMLPCFYSWAGLSGFADVHP